MAKVNLDMYLTEIYQKFIAINDEEYRKSREIFNSVFHMVKDKMSEQCPYFKQYSSEVLFAGSVYDGIKISKLDEFDMDIVIRLPVNYEEIIIENDQPGFVKLKINSFDHLDKQKHLSDVHMVIRDWRDSENYLLQNKFRQWLHGIVQKAINVLGGKVKVGEVSYKLKYKQSGPAFTLNIRNEDKDEPFLLDVDLVPVIKFQHPRWPDGYRQVDGRQIKRWLVVPKPNKAIQDEILQNRCWRLSFQDHERDMMNGCNHLKMTIKLVKKLRDVLGLKSIANNHIESVFLWKIEQEANTFRKNKLGVVFRTMVEDLYKGILNNCIPYYWNTNIEANLIGSLERNLFDSYTKKLKAVLTSLDKSDLDKFVGYLLTPKEKENFMKSEFYEQNIPNNSTSDADLALAIEPHIANAVNILNVRIESLSTLCTELSNNIEDLTKRVSSMEKSKQRPDAPNNNGMIKIYSKKSQGSNHKRSVILESDHSDDDDSTLSPNPNIEAHRGPPGFLTRRSGRETYNIKN